MVRSLSFLYLLTLLFVLAPQSRERPDPARRTRAILLKWYQVQWQQYEKTVELARHFTHFLKSSQEKLTMSEMLARLQQYRKINSGFLERNVLIQRGLGSMDETVEQSRDTLKTLASQTLRTRLYPSLISLDERFREQQDGWIFYTREIQKRTHHLLQELHLDLKELMTTVATKEEQNWQSSSKNHLLISDGQVVRNIRKLTRKLAHSLGGLKDFFTFAEARLQSSTLQTHKPPLVATRPMNREESRAVRKKLNVLYTQLENLITDQKIRLHGVKTLMESSMLEAEVALPALSLHLYTNSTLSSTSQESEMLAAEPAPISSSSVNMVSEPNESTSTITIPSEWL